MRSLRPLHKPKAKAKPKAEELLFSRDTGQRIPAVVRDAAELWLDLFMDISGMTAVERPEGHYRLDGDNQRQWLLGAAELADYALELYEDRWPHESRKKQ